MTSKPDSVSTLWYHCINHTGRPLKPQVQCDAIGTTLADASTQWCSHGDQVLICIIGTRWNTTGRPLEGHWKHTGKTLATNNYFSSGILVYTGSKFQANWIGTGLSLNYHWLRVGVWITLAMLWRNRTFVSMCNVFSDSEGYRRTDALKRCWKLFIRSTIYHLTNDYLLQWAICCSSGMPFFSLLLGFNTRETCSLSHMWLELTQ